MNRIVAGPVEILPGGNILPDPSKWQIATTVRFCRDWCGQNEDPQRETQVQMLWSYEYLYIRFQCRYRELYVYESKNSRRDELWMRDVAEVFIQTSSEDRRSYREFEISPNGDWLDLDIAPGKKDHLLWDIKSEVRIDPEASLWTAEMAIPFRELTKSFDPNEIWRLNLFRIEGPEPRRFYSSWQPTHTPKANFHVPECFGELHFEERK